MPDISAVPPDFVKWWMIMLAFAVSAGMFGLGTYYSSKKSSGTAEDPVHFKNPVITSPAPIFAEKKGTDAAITAINAKVEAMARENVRAHQATANKLNEQIQGGHNRGVEILRALNEMETRITKGVIDECKEIHKRLNPLEKQVGEHEMSISALNTRCREIWERVCAVWDHVMKSKTGGK
jgi:hypothetical protein